MELPQEVMEMKLAECYTSQDVIEIIAHSFYYSINPNTRMNVPNNAYIYAEKMLQKYGTAEAREAQQLLRSKSSRNEKDTQIA